MRKYKRVCLSLDFDTDNILTLLASSCNMSKSEFVKALVTGVLQVKFYRCGIDNGVRSYDIYENFRYSERFNA